MTAQETLKQKLSRRASDAAHLARYRLNQLTRLGRNPKLSAIGRRIVDEIERNGVAIVPLEELPFAANPGLLRALEQVERDLDAKTPEQRDALEYDKGFEHCIPINPSQIAQRYPELFLWGLDEGLLDIIENCLGLPTAYHGVCVRKELVDGRSTGTRLWHADDEDINIIRVMIYLSDVLDDESGPFEYIPRQLSPSYRNFAGVPAIGDEQMNEVVPENQWRRATGPRGTVIFGAVAKVFHHGKVPLKARKMASYHYTSRNPGNERLCRQFSFQSGMHLITAPLSDRQRSCLWKYEQLLPGGARSWAARTVNRLRNYLPVMIAEPVLSALANGVLL